ncbi:hypothetical protein NL676_024936 [Syzygium grande]|nr:hypothetical protein NL676_024936 [Syzygium grande]
MLQIVSYDPRGKRLLIPNDGKMQSKRGQLYVQEEEWIGMGGTTLGHIPEQNLMLSMTPAHTKVITEAPKETHKNSSKKTKLAGQKAEKVQSLCIPEGKLSYLG